MIKMNMELSENFSSNKSVQVLAAIVASNGEIIFFNQLLRSYSDFILNTLSKMIKIDVDHRILFEEHSTTDHRVSCSTKFRKPKEQDIIINYDPHFQLHFCTFLINQEDLFKMLPMDNPQQNYIIPNIKHEFNNPLAIISGRVQIMKKNISTEEIDRVKFLNDIDSCIHAINRLIKIVDQINLEISGINKNIP